MRPDETRGTETDVRARRAARGFRAALSRLEPHARADLERFERIQRRKQRNERYKVFIVAAVVSALAAFTVVRILPLRTSRPVGPVPIPTNGPIVFGRSAADLDQRSLFTIAPDGSDEQRLPVSYTDCGDWSPDGLRVHVTASEYPGAPLRPAVINADGTGFALFDTSAPSDLNLGCGDWSPDGARLVLEGFGGSSRVHGIYTVGAGDGSGLTRLTHGRDVVPQYAPDGSAVVFQRTHGGRGTHEGVAALFVIESDGSGLHRITRWGAASSTGSWSPDGRIVFTGPGDALWMVDSDGTGLIRIPVNLDGRPYQPRWSPDGTVIVFGLGANGQTDIYTVRPDGSGLTQLTDTPGVDEWWPDWGVG